MEPFRLEEGLRVLFIALVASFISTSADPIIELLTSRQPSNGGAVAVYLLYMFFAWPIASGLSLVLGLALHITIRRWSFHPGVILVLFLVVASLVAWLLFRRPEVPAAYQLVALGTAFVSWLLYCFGPVSLLRYRFDPVTDSDF